MENFVFENTEPCLKLRALWLKWRRIYLRSKQFGPSKWRNPFNVKISAYDQNDAKKSWPIDKNQTFFYKGTEQIT